MTFCVNVFRLLYPCVPAFLSGSLYIENFNLCVDIYFQVYLKDKEVIDKNAPSAGSLPIGSQPLKSG